MNFIFVYVTATDQMEAEKISRHLLDKKLVACTNYFPIKSGYWWKGKIVRTDEYVLVLKTKSDKFALVKKEVAQIHSYKIPCITKINVEPNSAYAHWLKEQLI